MTINSFSKAISAYNSAVKNTHDISKSLTQSATGLSAQGSQPTKGTSFADLVGEALQNSRDTAYKAEQISTQGLLGKADLSDVITAVSGAELALNTVISVRDRMITAYQDIVKMPI